MCTVSWLPAPDGYALCFNRDESRTRKPGLPPAERVADGVRFVAPLDGDHGGTWISLNEFGLTLSLLNRYHTPRPVAEPAQPVSRGRLVLDLAPARGLEEIREQLSRTAFDVFRPFTLVAVEPGRAALLAAWDGSALALDRHDASGLILTSSAFDEPSVTATRRATFESGLRTDPSAETLVALHRSHRPEAGAHSVCMHRPDAETQSLSQVLVNADTVRLAHVASAPCRGPLGPALVLARRAAPATARP
jgi:transport and Golgi organization protein 2